MNAMFGNNISPLQGLSLVEISLHRALPCVNRSNPFGAGKSIVAEITALKGLNQIAMGEAHRMNKIDEY